MCVLLMALSNYYFSHSHPEAFKSVGKCITRIYILLCDIDIARTYCVHFSHQNSFLLFVAISNTFLLFAMHQQCWYAASSQFSFKHVRAEKKKYIHERIKYDKYKQRMKNNAKPKIRKYTDKVRTYIFSSNYHGIDMRISDELYLSIYFYDNTKK